MRAARADDEIRTPLHAPLRALHAVVARTRPGGASRRTRTDGSQVRNKKGRRPQRVLQGKMFPTA
jgi:hypothetical protein